MVGRDAKGRLGVEGMGRKAVGQIGGLGVEGMGRDAKGRLGVEGMGKDVKDRSTPFTVTAG